MADGTAVTASTLEVGSFTTVFPEGFEGSADSQAVLIRVEPGQLQLPPDRLRRRPRRPRRVLEDLHPRRVPARALPRRDPRAALSVPPVDLRRARRRPAGVRACAQAASPAADRGRRRRRTACDRRLHRPGRPELLGASRDRPPPGRRGRRTARRHLVHQAQPAQGLPRPLVVHARRARALQLRDAAAHRHVPEPVLRGLAGRDGRTEVRTSRCRGARCPWPTSR